MKGSKKLASAVSSGNVVVKNNITGEIALNVNGRTHHIAGGQTLNLSALVSNQRDILKIGNINTLLQSRRLSVI